MIRQIALVAALFLTGTAASADAPKDQLMASVSRDLPQYVRGVDATSLSRHQLASLHLIMHGPDSASKKISMIRSVLGGPYSLRGLFFN